MSEGLQNVVFIRALVVPNAVLKTDLQSVLLFVMLRSPNVSLASSRAVRKSRHCCFQMALFSVTAHI